MTSSVLLASTAAEPELTEGISSDPIIRRQMTRHSDVIQRAGYFFWSNKGLGCLLSVLCLGMKRAISLIWRTQLSIDSIHMNKWLTNTYQM